MDMSHYRALFVNESKEYLKEIGECVVALEEEPADRERISALFRAAHSLKGMAASMEYAEMVLLSHRMEDLMIRVRDGALPFDSGMADLLLEGVDLLDAMLADLEAERPLRPPGDLPDRLTDYRPQEPAQQAARPAAALPPAAEETREAAPEPTTVRVRTELLDHLINLTGELITNKHRLLNLGRDLASPPLNEALAETSRLLRALHGEVMQVRLMPFEAICDRLQRAVREIGKKTGKELHFVVEGREIGLDRGILEQLTDPLNHILRNAIDHGLEAAPERREKGKPEKGEVRLTVARDRDQVRVTVTDDGRGMDPAVIAAAAVAKGVVSAEEAGQLTPRQQLLLTCAPGFSTASAVTEVSGRGVGMDAVQATVQKLGGTLTIDSEPGVGSRFTLRLPLSVAIIHALMIRCGAFKGAVPVTAVHRSVEFRREELRSEGGRRVLDLDDVPIPVFSLSRVLGLPPGQFPDGFLPLVVTEVKGRRIGVMVDELLGQHELFIKPLGRPLSSLKGVAGGATLGDGEVVCLLDLADLLSDA